MNSSYSLSAQSWLVGWWAKRPVPSDEISAPAIAAAATLFTVEAMARLTCFGNHSLLLLLQSLYLSSFGGFSFLADRDLKHTSAHTHRQTH